ncbi:MAG: hypothetical protein Q8P89_02780, partial [bacterium]|nr:hypothetical protein [bacterium]
QQGGPQRSFKFLIAAIATFLLLMAPFFITHPANTWYGIVGFSQYLILRGPNIWWLIDAFSRIILNVDWVNQLLIKIANAALLIVAIFVSITLLKRKKVKFDDQGLFGLISITLLLFNIFSKWISFHHFLLSFVFVILWDTLRTKEGFPVFGVTYAFSLVVASFIGNPLWQLWVLGINILAFVYLFLKYKTALIGIR